MTPSEALVLVENTFKRMGQLYGSAVFDEWALIRFEPAPAAILAYSGPRREEFERNFARDAAALQTEALGRTHAPGDFEFAREAAGTAFDALLMLGEGHLLIANNVVLSMKQIREHPGWLKAQIPFAELADKIRANPIA